MFRGLRRTINAISANSFRDAAENGDLVTVQLYIQQHPNDLASLDLVNGSGNTVLHLAAAFGRLDIVNALIAAGASLDLPDNGGWTALHRAAAFGRLDIVNALIAAGASLDLVNGSGNTALHLAAARGRLDIVNALIAAGASLDLPDNDGWTALHRAAAFGYLDIVNALIAAGASLTPTNRNGRNAADEAEQNGHPAIAHILRAAMEAQRAIRQAEEIHLLAEKGQHGVAIESALEAQKKGNYDVLWMLAENLHDNIGSGNSKATVDEIFHCFELVSKNSPHYQKARARMAELMQLAKPSEEKAFMMNESEHQALRLNHGEEIIRYGLDGLPHSQHLVDMTFHSMQSKFGMPEVTVKGDMAQVLAFIAQQSVKIEDLQQQLIQQQSEIIRQQQQMQNEINRLNDRIYTLESQQPQQHVEEDKREKYFLNGNGLFEGSFSPKPPKQNQNINFDLMGYCNK